MLNRLVAGHDSLWYWTQARAFNQKNQKWNAYFNYATAMYLATPADFLSSRNLDKLNQETSAVKPEGLPGEQPMVITGAVGHFPSATYARTVRWAGSIWLFGMPPPSERPVAARAQNLEVMKAMLAAHPELREGFPRLVGIRGSPESAALRQRVGDGRDSLDAPQRRGGRPGRLVRKDCCMAYETEKKLSRAIAEKGIPQFRWGPDSGR